MKVYAAAGGGCTLPYFCIF